MEPRSGGRLIVARRPTPASMHIQSENAMEHAQKPHFFDGLDLPNFPYLIGRLAKKEKGSRNESLRSSILGLSGSFAYCERTYM